MVSIETHLDVSYKIKINSSLYIRNDTKNDNTSPATMISIETILDENS